MFYAFDCLVNTSGKELLLVLHSNIQARAANYRGQSLACGDDGIEQRVNKYDDS